METAIAETLKSKLKGLLLLNKHADAVKNILAMLGLFAIDFPDHVSLQSSGTRMRSPSRAPHSRLSAPVPSRRTPRRSGFVPTRDCTPQPVISPCRPSS